MLENITYKKILLNCSSAKDHSSICQIQASIASRIFEGNPQYALFLYDIFHIRNTPFHPNEPMGRKNLSYNRSFMVNYKKQKRLNAPI